MFIAIHTSSDELVSGIDVVDPKSRFSDNDAYHCLLCHSEVTFDRGAERHKLFGHCDEENDCFSRPKNSIVHQLGCEQAIITVCNQLGFNQETVELESEIRAGGAMTRADVLIRDPEPVVIELYYKSRLGALYRKLDVILQNGYSCYIICVAPGKYDPAHTPDDFDESLQKYGPVEVGRFIPEFNKLTVGTRITADLINLIPPYRMEEHDYILSG